MRVIVLPLLIGVLGITTLAAETMHPRIPNRDILKQVPPKYPYEARKHHITGSGVLILHVDRASGTVTSVSVDRSTGHKILDDAGVDAFRQWRFRPGAVTAGRIWMPIRFYIPDQT